MFPASRKFPAAMVVAFLAGPFPAALLATPAHAGWPDKPIRIVVPFPAGGSTDSVARLSAEWLARVLAQPVTVENRTGASGTIAAEFVAQSPPDGHTLFMASLAQMSIVPQMGKVRYDPFKSFAPISVISTSFFALGVHPSLPAKNIPQLVALAKANPDKLSYGSSGTGSAAHLTMALFLSRAGVKMTHVPYKGVAPAIADLVGARHPGSWIVVADPGAPPLAAGAASARGLAVIALVGPEGGFTPEEFAALDAAGIERVGLGQHVLRVETAAIAVAARLA